jgi:hypothetical protein
LAVATVAIEATIIVTKNGGFGHVGCRTYMFYANRTSPLADIVPSRIATERIIAYSITK